MNEINRLKRNLTISSLTINHSSLAKVLTDVTQSYSSLEIRFLKKSDFLNIVSPFRNSPLRNPIFEKIGFLKHRFAV